MYAPLLLFMPVYVYCSFSRLLFQLFQCINSSRFRESVIWFQDIHCIAVGIWQLINVSIWLWFKSRLIDDGIKKDIPISLVNFTACTASDKHTMQFFLSNIFRYYRVWSKLIKCYHILNFRQLVYFSYSSTTVYQEWSNNFYIHVYIYISKSDNCPVILRKSACRQSRPEKNHYNLSDKRKNQPRMHYVCVYDILFCMNIRIQCKRTIFFNSFWIRAKLY